MTEHASQAEILLSRLVVELRSPWHTLVLLTQEYVNADSKSILELTKLLAEQTQTSQDSLNRKIAAIKYFFGLGHTTEEIASWGQSKTLSDFIHARRAEDYEKVVQMRFSLPGSLRELFLQDLDRVKKVLGIESSEQLFEYLHSLLHGISDEEHKHLAGELKKEADAASPSSTKG